MSAKKQTKPIKNKDGKRQRPPAEESVRLNKYLAAAGLCSRRSAINLLRRGEITVNGMIIKEPGFRVRQGDVVKYKNKVVKPIEKPVYILLNKPKDVITTTADDRGRKTVMDLLGKELKTRVFPVGRLDRNTTGLLLLTNDGALAHKLMHPSSKVRKVYAVELDKPLTQAHLQKIATGVTLDDGHVQIDAIAYADPSDHRKIGIELHSGQNRVVRRIFEQLGYRVVKLDRVMFAGLTKKNLPRGKWRYLSKREIILLKHFNPG